MAGGSINFGFDARTLNAAVRKVEKHVVSAARDMEVRNEVAARGMKIVEPYVLWKTGQLSSSSYVSDGKIVYDAVSEKGYHYAKVRFYKTYNPTKTHHPLARDYWTYVIKPGGACWNRFVQRASQVLHKAWSKNYG